MEIIFLFCGKMYNSLLHLKKGFGFKTIGETIRECIDIRKTIQRERDRGFTEIYVRSSNGLQKKITIPSQK